MSPKRLAARPISDLTAEERAVLLAALSAYECAKRYGAELTNRAERAQRAELFRQAQVASLLTERLLV